MKTELIRILLVEDNPDSIRLLQDELMSRNGIIEYRLKCVEHLSTGIDCLNKESFDSAQFDVSQSKDDLLSR